MSVNDTWVSGEGLDNRTGQRIVDRLQGVDDIVLGERGRDGDRCSINEGYCTEERNVSPCTWSVT